MEILRYILFGIIQGITEVLPISSSGHLVLFQEIINFKTNNLLIEIITNFGSLIAIIIFYFSDLFSLYKGLINKNLNKINYLKKIIIASIPSLIMGLFLYKFIENNKSLLLIGVSLIITGIMLFLISKKILNNTKKDISLKNSIYIGLSQVLALFPGISRSGTTTICGVFQNISFEESLKFSFMLYIPISCASLVLSLKDINVISNNFLKYFIAFITSFIFTTISLRLLLKIVKKSSFKYFSIYCLITGIVAIILNFI